MQTKNVALAVIERAREQPDAAAFFVAGRAISYSRTVDLMVHFARRMQAIGVTRDSTVGLATNDVATAAVVGLAVALLGSRWIALSPNAAAVYTGMTHVLTTVASTSRPGSVTIDYKWVEAPALRLAVPEFPGHAHPDDIWMIGHSSGTTGTPKFIPISYATLWRRIANLDHQDGVAPTNWNLFPPTSAHGARVDLGNLVMGGTIVAAAPWADLLRIGVNRVTGSPAQVSNIFNRLAPPDRRIRSLKVAGSQVTRKFVETGLRYFDEIHLAYGATEVGAVALLRVTDLDQFDGSVGLPIEGAEVEILGAEGRLAPPGTEGILRERTDWIVPGYLDDPALTATHFRDGWFYPGDLAWLDAGGRLHIAGRTNDVINVGGTKFNAADLDEVIQLHSDVADGYCFVSSTERGSDIVSALIALRPGSVPDTLREIRDMAIAKLGRPCAPRRFYVADAVPRTENGKPLRLAAVELAAKLTAIELA